MPKDATLTIRVPRPTRRRLEALARREGRSLSQQAERLIEKGLAEEDGAGGSAPGPVGLAGSLTGEPVAEYGDFRSVRTLLSRSIRRQSPRRGTTGR